METTRERPLIVDAFLFGGETDLLKIRLDYLSPVIDQAYAVQSDTTFTGEERKPVYWLEWCKIVGDGNTQRFRAHLVKGEEIEKRVYPKDAWRREWYQRNAIVDALDEWDIPDDAIVLISDVDEIPHREAVKALAERGLQHGEIAAFKQDFYYYNVNTKHPDPWYGTKAATARTVRELSPQAIRRTMNVSFVLEPGGGHYSYFMTPEQVQVKLASFAETWTNTPEFNTKEHIERCIREGKDLFGRPGHEWKRVETPQNLPEGLERYTAEALLESVGANDTRTLLQKRWDRLPGINGYDSMGEYLPVLQRYAGQVGHITEFGVFNGVSTTAFLAGLGNPLRENKADRKLYCVDLQRSADIDELSTAAAELGVLFQFAQDDTRTVPMEETDLLLVDSWHNAETVAAELAHAAPFVKRYIVFHDTEMFWYVGNDGSPGIGKAIDAFLREHPEWKEVERIRTGAGLMVIERQGEKHAPEPTALPTVSAQMDVLVVHYGDTRLLEDCINSLAATATRSINMYVWHNRTIDGGFKDVGRVCDQYRMATPFASFSCSGSVDNMGFLRPNNIMYCDNPASPFVLLLNNDVILKEGWQNALYSEMEKDPTLGAVGFSGGFWDENAVGCQVGYGDGVDYLEGWCVLLRREAVRDAAVKAGLPADFLFDEKNLRFAYGEDADLSRRLVEAGWRILAVDNGEKCDKYAVHARSQTTQKVQQDPEQSKVLAGAFEANHAYLRRRYAEFLRSGRYFAKRNAVSPERNPLHGSLTAASVERGENHTEALPAVGGWGW